MGAISKRGKSKKKRTAAALGVASRDIIIIKER